MYLVTSLFVSSADITSNGGTYGAIIAFHRVGLWIVIRRIPNLLNVVIFTQFSYAVIDELLPVVANNELWNAIYQEDLIVEKVNYGRRNSTR